MPHQGDIKGANPQYRMQPPGCLLVLLVTPCNRVPTRRRFARHRLSYPLSRIWLRPFRSAAPRLILIESPSLAPTWCHPGHWPSEIPHLDRSYYVVLAVASLVWLAYAYPLLVSGAKDSKNAPLPPHKHHRLPIHSSINNSPQRPQGATVKRLSYPSTPDFSRCQSVQVSPRDPTPFLTPQKPSFGAHVTRFRYVPRAGLSPAFTTTRSPGHFLPGAVSWSPNHRPCLKHGAD